MRAVPQPILPAGPAMAGLIGVWRGGHGTGSSAIIEVQ